MHILKNFPSLLGTSFDNFKKFWRFILEFQKNIRQKSRTNFHKPLFEEFSEKILWHKFLKYVIPLWNYEKTWTCFGISQSISLISLFISLFVFSPLSKNALVCGKNLFFYTTTQACYLCLTCEFYNGRECLIGWQKVQQHMGGAAMTPLLLLQRHTSVSNLGALHFCKWWCMVVHIGVGGSQRWHAPPTPSLFFLSWVYVTTTLEAGVVGYGWGRIVCRITFLSILSMDKPALAKRTANCYF